MADTPATQPEPPTASRGPLQRYRVMAYVTGSFLLVLTVTTLTKYLGRAWGWENATFSNAQQFIGIVHGWIFVLYFLTCVQLWMQQRWRLSRLAVMVLGGVVPVMSFVVERRVAREVESGDLS